MRNVIPLDTSADADAALFARWREMSVSERAQLTIDLCRDVDRVARAGILASHPDATEPEIVRELCGRRYGEALAAEAYATPRRSR